MNNSIDNNIMTYITYFRDQLHLVENECPDTTDGHLHSKILSSAFLDALSRTFFNQYTNRDRFVRFVTDFCDWPECFRMSLPHLLKLVKNKFEPEFALLRNITIQSMSQWMPDKQTIDLDRDPLFTDLKLVWPCDHGKPLKIDGLSWDRFQHCQLLYTYRNNLIHEFRITGRRIELLNVDKPYYSYLPENRGDNSLNPVHSWQLQYTAKFLRRLCTSGLSKLENYLVQNQIDPLTSIDGGDYWIRELNQ